MAQSKLSLCSRAHVLQLLKPMLSLWEMRETHPPHRECPHLNPWTCEYPTLNGQRGFAGEIKLKILR